ncbi:MAG: class I SAM-dependent methyltransferase [Alphaproteobacteria bacterium]|nr:class I SAM-dependent methyltransferase [Alphaproteobacteria bacterium]MBV9587857.1 class I SAM-dependent methyltransferase [Alphaproteobacteria bacterium]MBV9965892.1 class I SAM-dependent methyltransferase [Alphaproteobacteria bacterium]
MPDAFDKLAFETAQMARIGWFFGQKLLAARLAKPTPVPAKLRGRKTPDRQRLLRDLWRLIEQDWQNIANGVYAAPEDWRGNPLEGLRRAADFFADLRTVETSRHGDPAQRLLDEPQSGRYPRYYLRKFHYQTDGYLSEASAKRYDYQVEVLFGGGAAAMRRQALVPLRSALLELGGGASAARLLDLGCGTGEFLREVKRNYPRLSVTGLDLSSPYLRVAERRLADWSRVEFVEAAAEAIPAPDRSFDIVTALYLFHELPGRVRRAVADEIRRVLKPGGTLILVDSLQTGDEPDYDAVLDFFPYAFHEPYYASYLSEDLDALFAPGFLRQVTDIAYFSKVVSWCGSEGDSEFRPKM